MYALFEYKGKQYKAEKGALLKVDNVNAEKGSSIDVPQVLLVSDGEKVSVGAPYVEGASIKLTVEDSVRDKKVLVFKYKAKKDYHRLIGHRQKYTMVRVDEIKS